MELSAIKGNEVYHLQENYVTGDNHVKCVKLDSQRQLSSFLLLVVIRAYISRYITIYAYGIKAEVKLSGEAKKMIGRMIKCRVCEIRKEHAKSALYTFMKIFL